MENKKEEVSLYERIKELNCLLNISKCFTLREISLDSLFEKIIRYLIPAWQFPGKTVARIVYKKIDVKSVSYIEPSVRITQDICVNGSVAGFIEVGYINYKKKTAEEIFFPEEVKLLEAVGELVESMIEIKNSETAIKKSAEKLHEQKQELSKKNIALKEILSTLELEKKELKDSILINIETLVLPALHKLRNPHLDGSARSNYISVIEQNLKNLTSSLVKDLGEKKGRLSPREIEISNLIKNGLHNKEIAAMLSISVLTVERHRFNIRKKFDLTKRKANLQSFLQQL